MIDQHWQVAGNLSSPEPVLVPHLGEGGSHSRVIQDQHGCSPRVRHFGVHMLDERNGLQKVVE